MNYLKSITSSVLSSTGVSFPFNIGERIPGLEAGSSIWEIREGVKKVGIGWQVGILTSRMTVAQLLSSSSIRLLDLCSQATKIGGRYSTLPKTRSRS